VAFEKHLLVDGANILHAWPELRALLPRDRDAARARLAQRLSAIHDGESVRVTLVHDGRGTELVIERPSAQETFSVLYTPSGLTADDVIERLVAKSASVAECTVASGDRAIRQTITALGAAWISPDDLAAWIDRAEKQQARSVERLRRSTDQEWRRHD
jgi:predicted RNA-binding protein with PIN domain